MELVTGVSYSDLDWLYTRQNVKGRVNHQVLNHEEQATMVSGTRSRKEWVREIDDVYHYKSETNSTEDQPW
jgi:hypothetical protein